MFEGKEIKKILVIRLSSLGDVVLTTPVFRNIKEAWPHVHVSVFVKKEYMDVFRGNPYIDEVIPFVKDKGIFFYISEIKKKNFDVLIDLHNNIRSNLVGMLSGIKRRVKYNKGVLARRLFVWNRILSPELKLHTVERYLKTLEEIGIKSRFKQTELFFPREVTGITPVGLEYNNNITRILIIQTAFLGDVVLTIPLIVSVKKKFPESFLAVMAIPSTKDVLEAHPAIDELIVFDKKGSEKGLFAFIKLIKKIKSKDFDIAILPHRSFKSALMVWLAQIPRRLGFDRSQGSIFLNELVAYDVKKHDLERNLDLAKEIDATTSDKEIFINTDKEDWLVVEDILKAEGISSTDVVIGISPGSVWPTKRWLAKRFALLSDRIIKELGAKVVVFGGPKDVMQVEQVMTAMKEKALNLSGRLSLKQLAAFIKRCRVFVTNDSGPMHIAVAGKVPVVAIFGPTTRELGFYPYGDGNTVIEKNLDCRPCGLHGGRKCKKQTFDCMELITVSEVFIVVKDKLNKTEGVRT
ncbi:MAG: lipopolysaccharide heptosyltransferase II [bacterium]